jgi:hypothetical protein
LWSLSGVGQNVFSEVLVQDVWQFSEWRPR